MEKIDLTLPRFAQAQVLAMVPALKARDLQNWGWRGILKSDQKLGKGVKRLYSGLDVVQLRFMSEMIRLGLSVGDADEMTELVRGYALELHEEYPAELGSDDVLHWVVHHHLMSKYIRGYVFRIDGKHQILIRDDEEWNTIRSLVPLAYIVVEIDQFLLAAFNSIYQTAAGKEAAANSVSADSDEERALLQRIVALKERMK